MRSRGNRMPALAEKIHVHNIIESLSMHLFGATDGRMRRGLHVRERVSDAVN